MAEDRKQPVPADEPQEPKYDGEAAKVRPPVSVPAPGLPPTK